MSHSFLLLIDSFFFFNQMQNQTFPIYYRDTKFLVDPSIMFTVSKRFAELCKPFTDHGCTKLQLVVLYNKFTERSFENFLKICQGLPSDVLDSEMKEICEIAKLFKADQIYKTSIEFVHRSLDPRFYIPDDKFDEADGEKARHFFDMEKEGEPVMHRDASSTDSDIKESDSRDNSVSKDNTKVNSKNAIIYEISAIERNYFYLMKNNIVLLSANKKSHEISIGKGIDADVGFGENAVGTITQKRMRNIITLKDQIINLEYIKCKGSNVDTFNVDFVIKNKRVEWYGVEPKYDENTKSYTLNLKGAYNARSIASTRNTLLKDAKGKDAFIVRKVCEKNFEIECSPDIDPEIVFALGLSVVIGPYTIFGL